MQSFGDLVFKYSAAEIRYNGTTWNGYLSYLVADYAESVAKLAAALSDFDSRHSDWSTAAGAAVGIGTSLARNPLLGWITMGPASKPDDKLHEASNLLLSNYEVLQLEHDEERRLIALVTMAVTHFREVDKKIQLAIDAVCTLSQVLQTQVDAFRDMRSVLERLGNTGLSSTDSQNRQKYIETRLAQFVTKVQQLQDATDVFTTAILEDRDAYEPHH